MAKIEEMKKDQNTEELQQEQTPKKEGFLKRVWGRFGRDLRDLAIGGVVGAVVTAAVFSARSKGASDEESTTEDQNTDSYDENNDVLEVSDE